MTNVKFHLPKDIGEFRLTTDEVMYYLYLPIKWPGSLPCYIPDERLGFINPLLHAIRADMGVDEFINHHVYLTIKRQYVGAGSTANRPGWHCDGWGSDDINYIWYDDVPTIFTEFPLKWAPEDHNECLEHLEDFGSHFEKARTTYPTHHLLRLDSGVIHRVETNVPQQVMRTFVKITISKERFNLLGNSRNPLLPDKGKFIPRDDSRNHPVK